MNIYVDFDDCLCETARYFAGLAKEEYGKNIPYEEMHFFNMKKTFGLTEEEYDRFMATGHEPEVLLGYEETPGATDTIKQWKQQGHNVFIITGRPYNAYEPSRQWLDQRGLQDVKLYCLDKYGRDIFTNGSEFSLELEDFYKMHFDYAVEDSPLAFPFLEHFENLQVMVFDRPWNRAEVLPGENFHRCMNWEEIRGNVKEWKH